MNGAARDVAAAAENMPPVVYGAAMTVTWLRLILIQVYRDGLFSGRSPGRRPRKDDLCWRSCALLSASKMRLGIPDAETSNGVWRRSVVFLDVRLELLIRKWRVARARKPGTEFVVVKIGQPGVDRLKLFGERQIAENERMQWATVE